MKFPKVLATLGFLLLVCGYADAQQPAQPKRVLVLYWYNKDHPWNVGFEQSFESTLRSSSDPAIEYYPEYLENNRFPGEKQALLFRDYLRQKYADHPLDVVVANSDYSLDFLLRYRKDLFPTTPIVFVATQVPTAEQLAAGAGLTGLQIINDHRQNLELMLKLHPGTQQVFVISGTIEHDKRLESLAKQQLQGYEKNVQLVYLTDLSLEELTARIKTLPAGSLILHVWQQSRNQQDKVIENNELLTAVGQSATVPVYAMNFRTLFSQAEATNSRTGVVGGYVTTSGASGKKTGDVVLSIARGTRAQEIPVQDAPSEPYFDWRELQRWRIDEAALPPERVVQFRQITLWTQYKFHFIGIIALVGLEAGLIVTLLVQRGRRARAEESLRLSEEKFYRAFRSSPDAVIIVRKSDSTILDVNDRWQTVVGYDRAEAIGRTTLDLKLYFKPEDRTELYARLDAAGSVRDFETFIRTKSGEIRTVKISVESIAINKEVSFLAIIHDVTELKNSERALRQSETRSRLVVDTAMDAVVIADAHGRITGWNRQAETIFGWRANEAVGKLLTETIIPPRYRETHQRGLAEFHATGEGALLNKRNEIAALRRDGTEFPVELTIAATYLGQEVMFIGFLRDITARKQAEDQMQRLTGQLIHLQDEERKRIAGELHDGLGQSLVIIKNRATIGLRDTVDSDRVREQLEEISSTATAAIDEVHEIAHNLRPYELDRLGLVKALETMVNKLAHSSSVRFFADLDRIDGFLSPAAETSIYRIVQESLNNVVKHAAATEARVSVKQVDRQLIVSVSDNGSGIDRSVANGNGGGFGLVGIAERARLLGGSLEIESPPAGGTKIIVTVRPSESVNGGQV